MITTVMIGVVALLGVGLYGLLITRNLIKVVVALQILVKGAALALVAAGTYAGQPALGASMAATVIVADTVVAAVALAMAMQVRRHVGTMDLQALTTLKR